MLSEMWSGKANKHVFAKMPKCQSPPVHWAWSMVLRDTAKNALNISIRNLRNYLSLIPQLQIGININQPASWQGCLICYLFICGNVFTVISTIWHILIMHNVELEFWKRQLSDQHTKMWKEVFN